MDFDIINVNILQDGYVISFTKDGRTIEKLSGGIEVIYDIVDMADNYYRRTEWFKANFGVATPLINYNFTRVEEDGTMNIIGKVEPSKFREFINKIKYNDKVTDVEFIKSIVDGR